MTEAKNCSQTSLNNKFEQFLALGKKRFYLHEIRREFGVSLSETEDFLIPLLKKNTLEGSLEVRCPNCCAELGTYKKYPEIPNKVHCELCGKEFQKTIEDVEILLEVKGDFFRSSRLQSRTD